ncbi:MAG: hypothetical protein O2904_01615 [bacterium]|nr:hypothetical protein [bacterium]
MKDRRHYHSWLHRWHHKFGILMTAVMGSLAMTAILAITVKTITQLDKQPSDLLPGKQTIAVFHLPEWETLQQFSPWFPELDRIISTPVPRTIAIVDTGKSHEIIEFSRSQEMQKGDGIQMGTYAVQGSPEALELLKSSEPRLAKDTVFQTLSASVGQQGSWVFVRREGIPKPSSIHQDLRYSIILANSTAIAISQNANTRTIARLSEPEPSGITTPLPTSPTFQTILTLSLRSLSDFWKDTLLHLEKGNQSIVLGIVKQRLHTVFGPSVSLEYDILPLLENTTIIHMTQSGSIPFIQIAGTSNNIQQTIATMDRMHEGMRSQLPNIRVQSQMFDGRFWHSDIRSDHSAIEQKTITQDQWQIRSTHTKDAVTGLFTATYRDQFIVSNTEVQLREDPRLLLSLPETPTLLRSARTIVGQADTKRILEHLGTLIRVDRQTSTLLGKQAAQIQWSVQQRGDVTTLVITNVE